MRKGMLQKPTQFANAGSVQINHNTFPRHNCFSKPQHHTKKLNEKWTVGKEGLNGTVLAKCH